MTAHTDIIESCKLSQAPKGGGKRRELARHAPPGPAAPAGRHPACLHLGKPCPCELAELEAHRVAQVIWRVGSRRSRGSTAFGLRAATACAGTSFKLLIAA